MKKLLVVGIIILFVGVGFQTAFAVESRLSNDNNSSDNDLIEVTFRICEFNKKIENTVWLTQEESDTLDNIIDNVKKDLENAKGVDEEKEIRNNAIISFSNLGLLPDNVNCKELQKMVSNNIYQKIRTKEKSATINNYESDGFYNSDCSITGESDKTWILPHLTNSLWRLQQDILNFIETRWVGPFLRFFLFLLLATLDNIAYEEILENHPNPSDVEIWMGFSATGSSESSEGWIHTNGTNGEKSFEGKWYGQLEKLTRLVSGIYKQILYIGVTGFTGMQIYKYNSIYYMGNAKEVHIGTEPLP